MLPSHVHLAKGCYPGQEAVARMWMLGRPRRQLAVVAPDGAVEVGWTTGQGRDRVEVTSITRDRDRALAFVPPSAAPGDRFSDDTVGGAVVVERLVGADRWPPGHDPAVRRRRDR